MKILVIDDKTENLETAKEELKGHDVVTTTDYIDGLSHIQSQDHTFVKEEEKFDMVLTDLLMPPSDCNLGNEGRKIKEEIPAGMFILLAAIMAGVKYIGVVSNLNHHDHPAIICFEDYLKEILRDSLKEKGEKSRTFNNSKICLRSLGGKAGEGEVKKSWLCTFDELIS